MRWMRNKQRWPGFMVLAGLLAVALAAPPKWQAGARQQKQHSAILARWDRLPAVPQVVSRQPDAGDLVSAIPDQPATPSGPGGPAACTPSPPAEVADSRPQCSGRGSSPLLANQQRATKLAAPRASRGQDHGVADDQNSGNLRAVERPTGAGLGLPSVSSLGWAFPRSSWGQVLPRCDFPALLQLRDSLLSVLGRVAESQPATASAVVQTAVPTPAPSPTASVPEKTSRLPLLCTRPDHLLRQLQLVAEQAPHPAWASRSLALVRQLANSGTPSAPRQILSELEQLAQEGADYSDAVSQPEAQTVAMALQRRVGIWQVLLLHPVATGAAPEDAALLRPVLAETTGLLAKYERGAAWRDYLLLDDVAAGTSPGVLGSHASRAELDKLARLLLDRFEAPRLTAAQHAFLHTPPLLGLYRQLQACAARSVNLELLDALVERYESQRATKYAAAIARRGQWLRWSADPAWQALAAHLEEHYRGSNLRIAISADLMNRMLPQQKARVSPVRERVAGSKVRGQSRTTTQLRVQLLPASETWRIALEAFGHVYSETRSETWPARVRNASKMQFQTRKIVELGQAGVDTRPAQARAYGRNELLGVDSQFDRLPFLGQLFQDLARQKHRQSRPIALQQVKSKVASQARRRMDQEADPKLHRLEEKFRGQVETAVGQLGLVAEPLEMRTTEDRAVMQVRLANPCQLAAHTLRPWAPSDSLASVQLHETACNNALSGLGLDGRRMTTLELFQFITAKLGLPPASPPRDLPQRASITFAARGAVRVLLDGDRLELILGIAELARGRDKIKNFEVHAFFRPTGTGLDLRLVRDGTLQFAGRRLKTGPRVVLHSVLGKLLPKDQEIGVFQTGPESDPRWDGLMVTQLEITAGWFALAIGPRQPERVAWRTSAARRPSP